MLRKGLDNLAFVDSLLVILKVNAALLRLFTSNLSSLLAIDSKSTNIRQPCLAACQQDINSTTT